MRITKYGYIASAYKREKERDLCNYEWLKYHFHTDMGIVQINVYLFKK